MSNHYLVLNDCIDPYYNLALEEYLLLHYVEGTVVMLWQNENTVVVGRNQNTWQEINREYVEKNHIHVVRRTTGGGAVYHDLGNLNYSFIADCREGEDKGVRKFLEPVVRALVSLGAEAEFSGRNDILVKGKKVSGTAQRRYKNRILNHGCLLYDSDLSKLAASLRASADKFESKAVKSVRSRVGNITELMEERVALPVLRERIAANFLEEGNYRRLELAGKEREEVEKLQREKYMNWEWNYGHPIPCAICNRRRYSGGTIEARLDVADGRIRSCQIFGDFMALRPADEAAGRLVGCRYRYEDVLGILERLPPEEYFGTISAEEAAACILC